jgi:hypothetical protein
VNHSNRLPFYLHYYAIIQEYVPIPEQLGMVRLVGRPGPTAEPAPRVFKLGREIQGPEDILHPEVDQRPLVKDALTQKIGGAVILITKLEARTRIDPEIEPFDLFLEGGHIIGQRVDPVRGDRLGDEGLRWF